MTTTSTLDVTHVDVFGPIPEPLKPIRRISNEVFRIRFVQLQHEEGLTLNDVAVRLGWTRGARDPRPDASRVEKALGLRAERSGGRISATRKRVSVSYELAVRLADALDLDPYQAGV